MARQSPSSLLIGALSDFELHSNTDGYATPSIVRRPAELRRYLKKHPFLVPLLQEIRGKLHEYFPDCPASLAVVTDPEEAGSEQMVVSVATSLAPHDAVGRLGQFDRDWWLDNVRRAQGKICVDVEFR
jgi:hypothetical protein